MEAFTQPHLQGPGAEGGWDGSARPTTCNHGDGEGGGGGTGADK